MKMKFVYLLFLIFTVLAGCRKNATSPEDNAEDDISSGGDATTFSNSSLAFSQPAPNLSAENLEKHLQGDLHFEQSFVKAPAIVNGGLGPLFISNSCSNCHISDGKGLVPSAGFPPESMLFRISVPGEDENGGPKPVPGFGTQLQSKAVIEFSPEGNVNISYSEIKGTYPDGAIYYLRKPNYQLTGNISSGILISPRIAPPVFGLGLLEAVPEDVIKSLAVEDSNEEISGKVNYVWNSETKQLETGRFGWKANTPTLRQQVAGAYNEDMGITSPYFKMENCHSNDYCDTLNDDPEITEDILRLVTVYAQTLAVPARRNTDDENVIRGKFLFSDIGCNSCHVTTLKTGNFPEIPELSNQKIHPYTDLLLHDMGDELADNRPDFSADGNEWRTPPLWGIGLIDIVNGNNAFLHDGRARNLEEAILWHGGEAQKTKERFINLNSADRKALLEFLKSL